MTDRLNASRDRASLSRKSPTLSREGRISLEFRGAALGLLLVLPLYALIEKSDSPYFYAGFVVGASLLLAFAVHRWGRRREGWVLVSAFLGAALFQNLLMGAFLGSRSPENPFPVLVLIELKTVVLFAGAFLITVFALRRRQVTPLNALGGKAGVFLAAWVILSLSYSPASWFSKLAYLRSFLATLAGWQLGRFCVRRGSDFDRSIGVFLAFGVLVSLFSVVELCQPDIWWDQLHLGALTSLKGPVGEHTAFFGFEVRRLFTAIGTPINAAFILGAMLLLAWSLNRKVLSLVLLAELVLTFVKSGILATSIGAAVLLLFGLKRRIPVKTFRRYAFYGILGALLSVVLYFRYLGVSIEGLTSELDVNGVGHVTGLVIALQGILRHPFGRGLGVGGNWSSVAEIVGLQPASSGSVYAYIFQGGESDIGALTYQLGIVGLLAFLAWCAARFKELLGTYNCLRDSFPRHARLALAALGACLGVVIASLFTEAAYIPQVSGIVFMFGGLAVGFGQLPVPVRRSAAARPQKECAS